MFTKVIFDCFIKISNLEVLSSNPGLVGCLLSRLRLYNSLVCVVCSSVYGTLIYKEPLTSLNRSRASSRFRASYGRTIDESDVKQ